MTTNTLYGMKQGYKTLQTLSTSQPVDALTFVLLETGNTLEQLAQQPL